MKTPADIVTDLMNETPEQTETRRAQAKAGRESMYCLSNLMGNAIADLDKLTIKAPNGYKTTIEINGYELDCIVDYTFIPLCRGGRGDYGQKTEPDEPAHIEMDAVYIKDGAWNLVDIPESAMTNILDEILECELG